jgi:splicing factor 3B subunit 3
MLTYYELDLGLNHVVRKWSEPTDPRANLLVQVPGGQLASSEKFDGPSGVLVCCEDHIIYRHMDAPQHRVPIPRRKHPLEDTERGLLIVAAVMHKMKARKSFYACPYIPNRSMLLHRAPFSSSFKARRVICTK